MKLQKPHWMKLDNFLFIAQKKQSKTLPWRYNFIYNLHTYLMKVLHNRKHSVIWYKNCYFIWSHTPYEGTIKNGKPIFSSKKKLMYRYSALISTLFLEMWSFWQWLTWGKPARCKSKGCCIRTNAYSIAYVSDHSISIQMKLNVYWYILCDNVIYALYLCTV